MASSQGLDWNAMEIAWFTINLGAALLLGMAIGLERQFRQHAAGLRTNALVCLGAAMFVSVARMIDHESSPTRVAGQVVSGIGFLGGGVILREGLNVRGLATAATMWCSAAVGTLAGLGFLVPAAIGTAGVLFIHLALRPLVRRIEAKAKGFAEVETSYRMRVVCPSDQAAVIRAIFIRHVNAQPAMMVQGITTQDTEQADRTGVVVDIFSTERNDKYMNDLVSRISIEPSVSSVSWEKLP
jgi:putative Mg2+ transporter-C (MgtC) family protein